jgi:hypothetical protein
VKQHTAHVGGLPIACSTSSFTCNQFLCDSHIIWASQSVWLQLASHKYVLNSECTDKDFLMGVGNVLWWSVLTSAKTWIHVHSVTVWLVVVVLSSAFTLKTNATDHSVLILNFLEKQVISFCISCDMIPLLFQKSIILMTYSTMQTDCLKQKKFERHRKAIHFSIQDLGGGGGV